MFAIQGTAGSDYGENHEEEWRLGEQNVGRGGLGQDENEQNWAKLLTVGEVDVYTKVTTIVRD